MEAVTDGCSGFQWLQGAFPKIVQCCAVHDTGGTDGMLMDCLQGVLPEWAWAPMAFCVALMVLFRPAYNLWKKWKKIA